MCRSKDRKPPRFAAVLVAAVLTSAAAAGPNALESEVVDRAAQVDRLKQEFDAAAADFQATPAAAQLADVKARYVLKLWEAKRAAEARHEDAERLLDAQRRLLGEARQEIDRVAARSPELRKLRDLGSRAEQAAAFPPETRGRVVEVVDAVRRHADQRARLARLRASEAQLKGRIVALRSEVAAQEDAEVKAHNEGLLARAEGVLRQMGGLIADAEAAYLRTLDRALELTGSVPEAAVEAVAGRLQGGWNRAARRAREMADLAGGLTDLRLDATVEFTGTLRVGAPGEEPRAVAPGQPLELKSGQTVQVGANANAVLKLPDGSRVRLQGNTSFTLDLDSDAAPGGLLRQGKLRLQELGGLRGRKIRTPTVAIAVRGTDFILAADENGTRCSVASGEVAVGRLGTGQEVVLHALEQAAVAAGQDDVIRDPVTAADFERLADAVAPDVH